MGLFGKIGRGSTKAFRTVTVKPIRKLRMGLLAGIAVNLLLSGSRALGFDMPKEAAQGLVATALDPATIELVQQIGQGVGTLVGMFVGAYAANPDPADGVTER